jgi:hypothetical protein
MKALVKIGIFSPNPWVWILDKWRTANNRKTIYIIGLLPSIIVVFSLYSDVKSLIGISDNKFLALTIILLFLYGLINLFLISILQRAQVRIDRIQETYAVLHKDIIHKFRDYICENEEKTMKPQEIENTIKNILKSFNDLHMKDKHRPESKVTLKYIYKDKLFPIRESNLANRSNDSEKIAKSYIYNYLNNDIQIKPFIYVMDLDDSESKECLSLGDYYHKIKSRAANNYSTFIALPIRTGEFIQISNETIKTKENLGIIGFDMEEKYGFGTLFSHELEILGCFTDLLSIIVKDLQTSLKNNESIASTK